MSALTQARYQLAHALAGLVLFAPAALGAAWTSHYFAVQEVVCATGEHWEIGKLMPSMWQSGPWWAAVVGCALSAVLVGVLHELEQSPVKVWVARLDEWYNTAGMGSMTSITAPKLPGWFDPHVLDSLTSWRRALDVGGWLLGGLALGGLVAWLG